MPEMFMLLAGGLVIIIFAVVVSVLLAPVCKKALNRAYRGR